MGMAVRLRAVLRATFAISVVISGTLVAIMAAFVTLATPDDVVTVSVAVKM